MDNVAVVAARSLIEYGVMGVIIVLLAVAVVLLFRQNQKMYADNMAAHEKRVEDAKKFASDHAAAVSRLESTIDNMQEMLSLVRDIAKRNR